ncbi:hypothetical protein DRQ53_06455 [bacterium]|nr:MAG: hypothetical protein DRQ53_06455 [bacterium]
MTSMITRCVRTLLLPVFAVLVLAACSDDPVQPTTLGVEPEILNNPDAFEFQVSSVEGYTGTLSYDWSNSGSLANVDQSSAIEPGQAVLTLFDDMGTPVYTRDLSADGSSSSDAGEAGMWTIRVVFTGLTGTVNFRAEKATP